jgi:hypothetical protein
VGDSDQEIPSVARRLVPSAFLVETLKVGDIALMKSVFTKSVNPPIPEEFGIGGI